MLLNSRTTYHTIHLTDMFTRMSQKNITLEVTNAKCINSLFIASLPPNSPPTSLDLIHFQCHGFNERDHHPVNYSSQNLKAIFDASFFSPSVQFHHNFSSALPSNISLNFFTSLSLPLFPLPLYYSGLPSALAEFILATSSLFSMLHLEYFWFFCLFIFCF